WFEDHRSRRPEAADGPCFHVVRLLTSTATGCRPSSDADNDVPVLAQAEDALLMAMRRAVDEVFRFRYVHKRDGQLRRFLPVHHGKAVGGQALAIEAVIEILLVVQLAVMDVDGWKEQLAWIGARKRKGHRMDRGRAGLEFENGETGIPVSRQGFQCPRRQ